MWWELNQKRSQKQKTKKMMNKNPQQSIPRTKEEMDKIRGEVSQLDSKALLEKAQKINASTERAQRMVRMFNTEEFQEFWKIVNEDMEKQTNQSVSSIKGNGNGFDPLGQMAQLNHIQGGLSILETQKMTIETIKEKAKRKVIPTEELERKVQAINQITKQ